jgi:enterochelin esterase-like enzyme
MKQALAALICLLVFASSLSAQTWVTPAVSADGVEYRIFQSDAVGGSVSYHVYVPPAYATAPNRRFPVIYWLHGSNSVLTGIPTVSAAFATAMKEGRIPTSIVVFANGLPYGMWCDAHSGLQPVESMLIDLVEEIDLRFRTIAERRGRLVEGFSMGGYGAARIGLSHANLFAGFSMLGAGPMQLDFLAQNPNYQPLPLRQQILAEVYGNSLTIFEQRSPWRLAEQLAPSLPPGHAIRQIIGAADSTLQPNRDFHLHLLSLGIAHAYFELAGVGHSVPQILASMGDEFWSFHRRVLADALFADGFELP